MFTEDLIEVRIKYAGAKEVSSEDWQTGEIDRVSIPTPCTGKVI